MREISCFLNIFNKNEYVFTQKYIMIISNSKEDFTRSYSCDIIKKELL